MNWQAFPFFKGGAPKMILCKADLIIDHDK